MVSVPKIPARLKKLLKELKVLEIRVRGELNHLKAQVKTITDAERAKRRARRRS
jgi:hypothetical protein